jgi:hypothetical protein
MATGSDLLPVDVVLVKRDGDSLWLSPLSNVLRERDSGAEDGRGCEEERSCEGFEVERHRDRWACTHLGPRFIRREGVQSEFHFMNMCSRVLL